MATKLSALTELLAAPAEGDYVAVVDTNDTTQAASGTTKKLDAVYLAVTDGERAVIEGGGTIDLGGFDLTVPKSVTVADADDIVKEFHYPFHWPLLAENGNATEGPVTTQTSYTSSLGLVAVTATYELVFDVDSLPANATVKFRVRMGTSPAGTAYARLRAIPVGGGSGTVVSGSEVTYSDANFLAWVTSGDLKANMPSGAHRYQIQLKNGSSGNGTILGGAELLVEVP